MDDWLSLLSQALAVVLRMQWQASLLALLIVGVQWLGRHRLAPRQRHALWLLLIARLLLPDVPNSRLSVWNWCRLPGPVEYAAAPPPQSVRVTVTTDGRADPDSAADGVVVRSVAPPAKDAGPRIWQSAAVLWLIGVVVLLGGTFGRYGRFCRRVARLPVVDDPELRALLVTCCRRVGVRRTIRLVVVPDLSSPALMGLWRPRLLLPPEVLTRCTREERRMVLLHELVHVRRGDVAVHWLTAAVRIVHWFNPLWWYVARRMQIDRELACDEGVLQALCPAERRDYGRALLHVLELTTHRAAAARRASGMVGLIGMFEPGKVLQERIAMILKHPERKPVSPRGAMLALLVALALVGLTEAAESTESPPPLPQAGAATAEAADGQTPPVGLPMLLAPRPAENEWTADSQSVPADLPADQRCTAEPLETRRYPVAELLAKIGAARQLDEQAAGKMLTEYLGRGMMRCACKTCRSSDWSLTVDVTEKTLVVRDTAAMHQRIAAELERLRKYGLDVVRVDVRLVTAPEALIRSLDAEWTILPSEAPPAKLLVPVGTASSEPLLDEDRPGASGSGQVTTTRNLPVLFDTVDQPQAKSIVKQFQSDRNTNVLFAPTVTVPSGRTASVLDVTQRPFVVGMADGKPRYEVFENGVRLQLRPVVHEDGRVRLETDVTVSDITKVETFRANRPGALDLQVPEVQTTRLRTAAELAPGQVLLLGGIRIRPLDGEGTSLLLMLEACKVDPEDLP